nr:MAG TPA_asm: hypothetical protein [Caudoviricetes sp.]
MCCHTLYFSNSFAIIFIPLQGVKKIPSVKILSNPH